MTSNLDNGAMVEQTFLCSHNGLRSLEIKVVLSNKENIGDYSWNIEDVETGQIVASGKINAQSFRTKRALKDGWIQLDFSKIDDSKNRVYKYTMKSNASEQESIAIYMTDKSEYAQILKVNSEEVTQALIIKMNMQRFNVETFIVMLGLIVYLAVFIRFMYRLFQ